MEFNLFIIPATLILVELLKRYIPSKFIPLVAVMLGAIMGLGYSLYYSAEIFEYTFLGIVFGASASGIYDTAKNLIQGDE
jgi:hypothetical protein